MGYRLGAIFHEQEADEVAAFDRVLSLLDMSYVGPAFKRCDGLEKEKIAVSSLLLIASFEGCLKRV
ncbi:hypothetical protein ACIPL1_23860 [Pseudomonas sp. NPDC090202]|uniref:hypothetical protein n=1 Tax=unclassified Pseudomonas TaxID=196821 RepID=UPI0038151770